MAVVATKLKRGQAIKVKGETGIILELVHRTPGKGNALVMATVRSFATGKTKDIRFIPSEKVETLMVERIKLEYSYKDTEGFHFMDLETYEDTVLSEDMIGEDEIFLVEGNNYDILLVDDKAVRLDLPASVEATVIEAPDAIRGDTAGNVQKPVTISSGITVQVPLFIKKDDVIKISTEDRSYQGRV